MEIATSNDYITFDEFISRLFELRAECNHEHYLCEIFIPFLKSCSIDGVKIVPVFDDRATGPKTEATTPTKERMATICAKKDDGNYVVPDYIYVPLEYSFNNPMNPYLMVETKKPAILDDGIHYRDLSDYISENESEIRAEINAFNRGYVLFTDGLTWMFLTIVDDQIVESPKYETIRLIDKYEKYHKTNRVKAKHQDKHVDLSYIGLGRFDVEIEPNEWNRLKEQIRKMLTELKGE